MVLEEALRRIMFSRLSIKMNKIYLITCSVYKPLMLVVCAWIVITLCAIFGPTSYHFGGFKGWFFYGSSAVVVIAGYCMGMAFSGRRIKRPDNIKKIIKLYKRMSILSFSGALLLQMDYLRTGRTIGYALDNVSSVRKDGYAVSTSFFTTIGFPLNCLIFSAILILVSLYARNIRLPKYFYIFNIVSAASLLMISFVATNRQMFLAYFIMTVVIVAMFSTEYTFKVFKRIPAFIKVLLVVFASSSVVYFLYISQHRGTEAYAIHAFNHTELDYNVPYLDHLSPGTEAAVYSIMFYGSHSIANVTAILDELESPLIVRFGMFNWYTTQAARFFPIYQLPSSPEARQMLNASGVNAVQWPTGLYTVYGSYGILGGWAFLMLIGCIWGAAVQQWVASVGLIPMLICFWVTYGCIFSIMYFPNETYYHSNLLVTGLLVVFKKWTV